jgi:lipoprotein-anchoring transpeptidase ErfK/SrfK
MTLMYLDEIDRRRSRTGCFLMLVLLLAVAGGATWFVLSRKSAPEMEDEAALITAAIDAAQPAETRTPSSPPVPGDDPGADLLSEAIAARDAKELLTARELGWRILDESRNEAVRKQAEDLLGEVNIELVMNPYPMPEKTEYRIKSGDMLYLIAQRNNMTLEHLFYSNRVRGPIDRPSIHEGDIIRLFTGRFSIEVSKSRNDLVLYMNNKFFKRYPVGTGEFGSTPVGEFHIVNRSANPVWYRPSDGRVIPYGHPENLLGTHWLGFNIRGYGIHGTWAPETIGHQMSDGCVRMYNEDVEELFKLITERTPVVVVE